MCSARADAKEAEQNSRKKSTEENQRSLTCLRVGVEGLEYHAETREKHTTTKKLTPNPTPWIGINHLACLINENLTDVEIQELKSMLGPSTE